jgi:hypothetical protein
MGKKNSSCHFPRQAWGRRFFDRKAAGFPLLSLSQSYTFIFYIVEVRNLNTDLADFLDEGNKVNEGLWVFEEVGRFCC